MIKQIEVKFKGRKILAIGITYDMMASYTLEDLSQVPTLETIEKKLYEDFEHITFYRYDAQVIFNNDTWEYLHKLNGTSKDLSNLKLIKVEEK